MSNTGYNEVEQSPDGRYIRFDEELGSGAYKTVYLALDAEKGVEVAWNTVALKRMPEAEKTRIQMETKILEQLSHDNIIEYYDMWYNDEKAEICFTTEIMTSGTLKQFASRTKSLRLKVIKGWARQILSALTYLHTHSPPIIHRDLKCDNIFVNGNLGQVRIGDFGLSAARHQTNLTSVLGTPEFMAPELYDEKYSEKVDIYAFGMCVLEMITHEYPYEECKNAAQIWKKVSRGTPPGAIKRIQNAQVRQFIEICLLPEGLRPSALDLLRHPFLTLCHPSDNTVVAVSPKPVPESTGSDATTVTDASAMNGSILYNTSTQGGPVTQANTSMKPNVKQPNNSPPNSTVTEQRSDFGRTATALAPDTMKNMMKNLQKDPHFYDNVTLRNGEMVVAASPSPMSREPSGDNNTSSPGPTGKSKPSSPEHGLSTQGKATPASKVQQPAKQISPQQQQVQQDTKPSTPQSVAQPDKKAPTKVSHLEVEVIARSEDKVNVSLTFHFGNKKKKQVKFDFEFASDTASTIAQEMTSLFDFADAEAVSRDIASNVELKVAPYLAEWRNAQAAAEGKAAPPESKTGDAELEELDRQEAEIQKKQLEHEAQVQDIQRKKQQRKKQKIMQFNVDDASDEDLRGVLNMWSGNKESTDYATDGRATMLNNLNTIRDQLRAQGLNPSPPPSAAVAPTPAVRVVASANTSSQHQQPVQQPKTPHTNANVSEPAVKAQTTSTPQPTPPKATKPLPLSRSNSKVQPDAEAKANGDPTANAKPNVVDEKEMKKIKVDQEAKELTKSIEDKVLNSFTI